MIGKETERALAVADRPERRIRQVKAADGKIAVEHKSVGGYPGV